MVTTWQPQQQRTACELARLGCVITERTLRHPTSSCLVDVAKAEDHHIRLPACAAARGGLLGGDQLRFLCRMLDVAWVWCLLSLLWCCMLSFLPPCLGPYNPDPPTPWHMDLNTACATL